MMLENELKNFLVKNDIKINGIIHVGAHDCQELPIYQSIGVKEEHIIWIDAIPWKIDQAKFKGIKNIFHSVISDKDNEDVIFNITNNEQSSSILELGVHSRDFPQIFFVNKIEQKTKTLDTFYNEQNLNEQKYNFWNFDIQGAELLALKGSTKHLPYVDLLYLEINEEHLYVNCALLHEIDSFLLDFGFKRIHKITYGFSKFGEAIYINTNKINLQNIII